MRRLILLSTEKEEPVPTDAQKDWHETSLMLGVQFLKATAVAQVQSIAAGTSELGHLTRLRALVERLRRDVSDRLLDSVVELEAYHLRANLLDFNHCRQNLILHTY